MNKPVTPSLLKRKILLSVLIALPLLLFWSHESDLAYNLAQQRPILLGRYTEAYLGLLLLLSGAALAAWIFIWAPGLRKALQKQPLLYCFRLCSLLFSVLLCLFFADLAWRLQRQRYYKKSEADDFYSRMPNHVYEGDFQDKPAYPFSYPLAPPPAPPSHWRLSTDEHGFRNQQSLAKYDWLVVGDSFAEGSRVSDQETWVSLLQEQSGQSFYNAAVSGGSPLTYLRALQSMADKIPSDGVLYMLYEGNDFRASNYRRAAHAARLSPKRLKKYLQSSPVRGAVKSVFIQCFGTLGSRRFAHDSAVLEPAHRLYPLSWLPFQVNKEYGNHFSFDVKRLRDHYISEAEFLNDEGGKESLRLILEFKQECDRLGRRMILLYAPDKPHVLLPSIAEKLPEPQLHAFCKTRTGNWPPENQLYEKLLEGIETRENIVRRLCLQENIEFISLSPLLKEKIAAGEQSYFCYDQHWSKAGHQSVAEFLLKNPALQQ
ncbi:MAG: hypothetical protein GX901_03035 [Lentisphaerae bacterium]|nr:hypothetical protein [Lentisphaerota bacterium]